MSGNTITINGHEPLTWYVDDSHMPLLAAVLSTLGEPQGDEALLMLERAKNGELITADGDDDQDEQPEGYAMALYDEDTQVLVYKIQKGPIGEHGVNGVQIDQVIGKVKEILVGFTQRLASDETLAAVAALDIAINELAKRTQDRTQRGVEGTENP